MTQTLRALGPLIPLALLAAAPAFAAQSAEKQQAASEESTAEVPAAGRTEYAYHPEQLQTLDFWHAKTTSPAPLMVFVHGGGWKRGDKKSATGPEKVEHFLKSGYAFASINYRLVPNASVEQQAADVAAALAWLRTNAKRLGVDATQIVLMGHSAGAHLVSLVGTDPQYLTAAGLSFSDLRGIIALDGACYDVPRQIADAGRFMRGTYIEAFGKETARQQALSPTLQAAAPNAPAFLILHIDRSDGTAQSEALAAALVKAGTAAEIRGFEGKGLRGHMEINKALGKADYPPTAAVDAWLKALLLSK